MKKKVTRIVAMLCVLIMGVSLTACGGKSGDEYESSSENF